MRVEIDEHSGFCFGVVNAIRKAEQELERGMLYCIGDIVHNDLEVERLRLRGLKTIEHEQFARCNIAGYCSEHMENLRCHTRSLKRMRLK